VAQAPFAPSSARFWRAYAVTLRPYLFFVSGAAGLAGLALTPLPAPALAAAFAAFFLSYGLGQALTDVSQQDTDALSAPYRPLVRGELSGRAVTVVSLAGLLGCSLVFFALDPRTRGPAAAAVAGLATYTPLKRRWWGGPPWNAWIVALLPLIGFLCGGPAPAVAPALPAVVASAFGTYAVFVILGYFKDVEADRATGYDTLPVHFGRRRAVVASAGFCAFGLAGSVAVLALVAPSGALPSRAAALASWGAGATLLVAAHAVIARTRRDDEAHRGIALSVRGFVALHLGEAAWLRPELALPGLVLLALLEAALRARPCPEQV
jgi:geranylgeranylglycerol-phosphate geranylgeranyltransferase